VPSLVLPACNELMNKRSDIATVECISGRDRVDCLDIVERREADFMAVDPEDLYLAFKKKNEDFSVFSDIRTLEEQQAQFRYEGIILVKKNSGINSLSDLRGKKSCHTGYGRNVGYKIPITKLKNAGIFKVDANISLSPVERELKALSELFTKSCLVGKYSDNPEVNDKLKRSYSNLCALCEDPQKCNYPDRFVNIVILILFLPQFSKKKKLIN
jgi:Transferrin